MGCASRASWIVAASMSAVEALKDQGGFCRWYFALRSLHQHTQKSHLGSLSSSSIHTNQQQRPEVMKQSEESLREVMYLSCWGPN
ncbi:hypothetical protein DsansV1_C13g0127241 [Dioscorea sansibarensis]